VKIRYRNQLLLGHNSLSSFALLSQSGRLLLILLTDFVEPLHVLEELGAPLKGDEKLCLLAVASVVRGLYSDRLSFDLLERGVVVPDQVLRCNHARGDCVSKGMELDRLVSFQVLLSEEHVEVGILFD